MMEIAQTAKVTRSTEFHTNSILLTGALMQGISSSWGNFNGMIAGKCAVRLVTFSRLDWKISISTRIFIRTVNLFLLVITDKVGFIIFCSLFEGDYAAGKEMLQLSSKVLTKSYFMIHTC